MQKQPLYVQAQVTNAAVQEVFSSSIMSEKLDNNQNMQPGTQKAIQVRNHLIHHPKVQEQVWRVGLATVNEERNSDIAQNAREVHQWEFKKQQRKLL